MVIGALPRQVKIVEGTKLISPHFLTHHNSDRYRVINVQLAQLVLVLHSTIPSVFASPII